MRLRFNEWTGVGLPPHGGGLKIQSPTTQEGAFVKARSSGKSKGPRRGGYMGAAIWVESAKPARRVRGNRALFAICPGLIRPSACDLPRIMRRVTRFGTRTLYHAGKAPSFWVLFLSIPHLNSILMAPFGEEIKGATLRPRTSQVS